MTYLEAVKKLGISLTEAAFNASVIIFDKKYGDCAKERGVYDDALSLFILHRDAIGDGAMTGGSRTVQYVSVTDGESTGTSNYLKDLHGLLSAVGCIKSSTVLPIYSAKIKDAC